MPTIRTQLPAVVGRELTTLKAWRVAVGRDLTTLWVWGRVGYAAGQRTCDRPLLGFGGRTNVATSGIVARIGRGGRLRLLSDSKQRIPA